ncbi:MAG: LysR family transcriptional regulator substrate-binding protein, partial [Verrucomicrobiota bacterium]
LGQVVPEGHRRGGDPKALAGAAPAMALRDHLPQVLQAVRVRFPRVQLSLRSGQQPQVEAWLERDEIDFAITLLEGHAPRGLQHEPLLELPLVLLVPGTSRFRRFQDVVQALAAEDLDEPLVSVGASELAPRRFREHLESLSLEWPGRIEVTDLELVDAYVRHGFGIGLGLAIPGRPADRDLRALPVEGVAPLRLGAVWRGTPTEAMTALMETLRDHVGRVAGTVPKGPAAIDRKPRR